MNVVISQPMYFPWVGLFEQIRLADAYVNYVDVQYSKGGFLNRVQVKTQDGPCWMTVPLRDVRLHARIDEVAINNDTNWRRKHYQLLSQAYAQSPFREEMLNVVNQVLEQEFEDLGSLAQASIKAICDYFTPALRCQFHDVRDLGVAGSGSSRVLSIVKHLGGDTYITGHGARHYLEHEEFEANGVKVEYVDYQKLQYPQCHGEFTPYVTTLDLIANQGKAGVEYIRSETLSWREFLEHE